MKKWIVVIILIGMLSWAVYNFTTSESMSNEGFDVAETRITEDDGELEQIGLEQGDTAPDFTLTTLEGDEVKLSDYRGERVMLNFWATWCPPCRAEMPDMEKFYHNTEIVILAVNLTDSETSKINVENFVTEHDFTFPILLDENVTVANMYAIQPIPTTYMIDSAGKISNKAFGPLNYDLMIQEYEMMD